jgi:transposase-like protein
MKRIKNGSCRIFSVALKKEKVKLIYEGKITVKQVSELYDVSKSAVYIWIKKYSTIPRDERVVVEKKSEAQKTQELYTQVRELEQALGRKQMELDYYKEIVKLVSESEGVDVEKKLKPKQ